MAILNSIFSNLMLVVIALVGFSFMVSGKPRKQTSRIRVDNKYFYRREYNSTGKLIRALIFIFILYLLGSSI